MADFFSGRVHSVIFENASQDFYILRMVLDVDEDADPFEENPVLTPRPRYDPGPQTVSVKGNVPGLVVKPGTWFGFKAKWIKHEKHGPQLDIKEAPVIRKWNVEIASALLQSHGIGERTLWVLRERLGDALVGMLDNRDVEGLAACVGKDTAEYVLERWAVGKTYFKTLEFLNKVGIPRNKIAQVWVKFAGDAEKILSTDPWSLVQIDGITFRQADEVAQRLGLDLESEERLRGAVLHIIKTQKGMGHLYMSSGQVATEVPRMMPDATLEAIGRCLAALHKQGALVIDRKTKPGLTALYDPWLHEMEVLGAKLLQERVEKASYDKRTKRYKEYIKGLRGVGNRAHDMPKTASLHEIAAAALEDWSAGSRMDLTKDQLQGALNALTEPVSVLTGLPGTGKSTSLRSVVQVLRDAEIPFLLVAPTGIAAKRLTSLTGAPAATIHRAFGAKGWDVGGEREATYAGIVGESASLESSDGSGEQWRCSVEPHPAEVVVIDESSMIDQHLLYRLMECTKPDTRMVFVGDAAQLPSVGPGNVLRDLISSDLFPMVNLVDIFRQEETSDIVMAAHAVFSGGIPETGRDSSSDFILVETTEEEHALDLVLKLAEKLYKGGKFFQVMSPRHAGTLGVTNLNSRLRELLNPKQPGVQEMRLGSEVVREDDRVMVVKNKYNLGVFNGDFGKVARLDRRNRKVDLKIHGVVPVQVEFDLKDASACLRLAYCVTVHKMQGQESDTIIMPLVKSFQHQLQRNLLYTAITRARTRVILVGHHEALVRAVHNNRPDIRNTLFLERLEAAFGR